MKPVYPFNNFEITASDSALIDQLEPHYRNVLRATGTYEQIAGALGVAVGTIKSRMNRARTKLVALRAAAEKKEDAHA